MDPSYVAPVMYAEWAPGSNPGNHFDVNPPWLDLPPLVSLSVRRGKGAELDRTEPASATLTFETTTDSLDPAAAGFPDARSYTPVRVMADYDGDTYQVFALCTVGQPRPVRTRGRGRVWEIECTDVLGWMAQMPLSSKVEHMLKLSSAWWVPGFLSRSPAGNGDMAFEWVDGSPPMTVTGANGGRQTREDQPISPGGANPSMQIGVQNQLLRGTSVWAPNPSTHSTFAISCLMQVPSGVSGNQGILVGRTTGGVGLWAVQVSAFGPAVLAEMRDLSGNVLATAAVGCPINEPFLLRVRWRRSTGSVDLWVDSASASASNSASIGFGAPTPAVGAPHIEFGSTTYLVGTQVADLAIASSGSGLPMPEWPAGTWDPPIGQGESWADRRYRLWLAAGIAPVTVAQLTGVEIVDEGIDPDGAFVFEGTLADHLLDWTEGAAGVLVMDRGPGASGQWSRVTMRGLAEWDDPGTPAWSFTDRASPPGSPTPIRYSGQGRTGGLESRIINEAVIRADNGQARAVDLDSIARYGRRTWDKHAGVFDVGAVAFVPDFLVDNYSEPSAEMGDITIQPLADGHQATLLALTAEIPWEPVQYVETSPATGTTMVNRVCRLVSEDWSWERGTAWTVTYRAAPVEPLT